MTFAAVGSSVTDGGSSFNLTPAAVGDLIIVITVCASTTVKATGLSSSNVTWSVLAGPSQAPQNSFWVTAFIGKVTSASLASVTVSYSGSAPATFNNLHEFSTTHGFALVALDASGLTGSGATTAYPTLTPTQGAGELYYGYAYNNAAASAGSTSGYSYFVDTSSNGACWNPACANSAQTPTWADTSSRDGMAVLLYEQPIPPPGMLMAGII